jgi:hypothetical protein
MHGITFREIATVGRSGRVGPLTGGSAFDEMTTLSCASIGGYLSIQSTSRLKDSQVLVVCSSQGLVRGIAAQEAAITGRCLSIHIPYIYIKLIDHPIPSPSPPSTSSLSARILASGKNAGDGREWGGGAPSDHWRHGKGQKARITHRPPKTHDGKGKR